MTHPMRLFRNAFVAFHVLAITVLALPGPQVRSRAYFDSRAARAQIAPWVSRLDAVGVHRTQAQLADLVHAVGNRYAHVREALAAPFEPYARWTGAAQGWRMFAFIERSPAELEVDAEIDGQWTPLYRPHSAEHGWNAALFANDRVCIALNGYSARGKGTSWPKLAKWIARSAAHEFPNATRVRVQMGRARSLTAEQVRAGELPERKAEQVVVYP